jgi:hypothetical protein
MSEQLEESEKKKFDLKQVENQEKDIPHISKSDIKRQEDQLIEKKVVIPDLISGKHDPVIEKPSKTFSIKEIISEDSKPSKKPVDTPDIPVAKDYLKPKDAFSPEALESAWQEFTDQLKGEGTRIISMFKSIKPEIENDQTIKIHLSNAAQKDTFVLNYKQRLINFLENKFILSEIDIETTIDLSETNDILYSDEQKYNYLFNKYPILKVMKKSFNLDIA